MIVQCLDLRQVEASAETRLFIVKWSRCSGCGERDQTHLYPLVIPHKPLTVPTHPTVYKSVKSALQVRFGEKKTRIAALVPHGVLFWPHNCSPWFQRVFQSAVSASSPIKSVWGCKSATLGFTACNYTSKRAPPLNPPPLPLHGPIISPRYSTAVASELHASVWFFFSWKTYPLTILTHEKRLKCQLAASLNPYPR